MTEKQALGEEICKLADILSVQPEAITAALQPMHGNAPKNAQAESARQDLHRKLDIVLNRLIARMRHQSTSPKSR